MMVSVFDREENIVGKGENAGYQHFLLFPQCFPMPTLVGRKNQGLFGKGFQLFTTQSWLLINLYKKPLENIVGKGENAGN